MRPVSRLASTAGSARAFCEAIEGRTHEQDTAQDLILETSFGALSPAARDAAALLGMCDVPLAPRNVSTTLIQPGSEFRPEFRRGPSCVVNVRLGRASPPGGEVEACAYFACDCGGGSEGP